MHQFTSSHFDSIKTIVKTLEQKLTQAHERNIKIIVLPFANALAEKNLPLPNEQRFEHYIGNIRGEYQALKSHIATSLQGGISKLTGAISIDHITQRINELTETIKQENEAIKHTQLEKARIAIDFNNQILVWCNTALVFLALGDTVIGIQTFMFLGDILILSVILGALTSFAQIFIAKASALGIREIIDSKKQRRYCVYTFIGFGIFSLALGAIRFFFVHNTTAIDIPILALNPITFAILNLVFIVASFVIIWLFEPDKANRNKLEEIQELEDKITEHNKSKERAIKDREQAQEQRALITTLHIQLIHDQKALCEKVDSLYESAIGIFISENILKRKDQSVPECLKIKAEPLSDPEEETMTFISKPID